eukprot:284606-Hanusia_phi.AAC.1
MQTSHSNRSESLTSPATAQAPQTIAAQNTFLSSCSSTFPSATFPSSSPSSSSSSPSAAATLAAGSSSSSSPIKQRQQEEQDQGFSIEPAEKNSEGLSWMSAGRQLLKSLSCSPHLSAAASGSACSATSDEGS